MPKLCAMDGCINNTQKGELCFYHRPRKPIQSKKKYIKPESDKARTRRIEAREAWFEANPPDLPDGRYFCYLDGLSEYCWGTMTRELIEAFGLEHTDSKARHPESKYDISKLRVGCPPCNAVKGSWSIEDLLGQHDHWEGPRS